MPMRAHSVVSMGGSLDEPAARLALVFHRAPPPKQKNNVCRKTNAELHWPDVFAEQNS